MARQRKSLAEIQKAEAANTKTFLYDAVVRPPSPEACARFARQIEAIIGRPITQADVDSLRNMGRPAKGASDGDVQEELRHRIHAETLPRRIRIRRDGRTVQAYAYSHG